MEDGEGIQTEQIMEQEISRKLMLIYGKLYSNLKCIGSHRVSFELYRLNLLFFFCALLFSVPYIIFFSV